MDKISQWCIHARENFDTELVVMTGIGFFCSMAMLVWMKLNPEMTVFFIISLLCLILPLIIVFYPDKEKIADDFKKNWNYAIPLVLLLLSAISIPYPTAILFLSAAIWPKLLPDAVFSLMITTALFLLSFFWITIGGFFYERYHGI